MRGPSHSPLGWAAVLLIVVAYAHVILEIAVAAKVMMSPAPGVLAAHLARQVRRWRTARLTKWRAALEAPAWRDREPEEVKE